jgi:hypothetical protein
MSSATEKVLEAASAADDTTASASSPSRGQASSAPERGPEAG